MSNYRTQLARQLRQTSTDAEQLLWYHLRNRRLHGLKFRRQAPIAEFIADFVCEEFKLIVELDGGQHSDEPARMADAQRTAALGAEGCTVVRYWNDEVLLNTEWVLADNLHHTRTTRQ